MFQAQGPFPPQPVNPYFQAGPQPMPMPQLPPMPPMQYGYGAPVQYVYVYVPYQMPPMPFCRSLNWKPALMSARVAMP